MQRRAGSRDRPGTDSDSEAEDCSKVTRPPETRARLQLAVCTIADASVMVHDPCSLATPLCGIARSLANSPRKESAPPIQHPC